MLFFLLVLVRLWAPVSGSPPKCRLIPIRQFGTMVPDQVDCSCRPEHGNYIGNLNFLKNHLVPIEMYDRTVEVTIRNCENLELDLNLADITTKNVNVRIQETKSVLISEISPVPVVESQQSVIIQNCSVFNLRGRIDCSRCSTAQGPLHFQFRNVSHVSVENVTSSAPVKISGRHLESVLIKQSFFSFLPWPGIFIFNATRVSIIQSSFPGLVPKSISLTMGEEVNVSYNLMDVSNALNMLQFQHINIKCNRRSKDETLPPECLELYQPEISSDMLEGMQEKFDEPTKNEVAESSFSLFSLNLQDFSPRNDSVFLSVLFVNDVYGLIFLSLAILLTICFLLIFCIVMCIQRRRKDRPEKSERKGVADLIKASTHLGTKLIPDPGARTDADEYSNSSRAHLAQGVDGFPDPLLLHYVTVQKVKSEEGEGGIVCGSLTLGPAYNLKDNMSTRAVSSNRLKNQTFSKV